MLKSKNTAHSLSSEIHSYFKCFVLRTRQYKIGECIQTDGRFLPYQVNQWLQSCPQLVQNCVPDLTLAKGAVLRIISSYYRIKGCIQAVWGRQPLSLSPHASGPKRPFTRCAARDQPKHLPERSKKDLAPEVVCIRSSVRTVRRVAYSRSSVLLSAAV